MTVGDLVDLLAMWVDKMPQLDGVEITMAYQGLPVEDVIVDFDKADKKMTVHLCEFAPKPKGVQWTVSWNAAQG